MTKRVFTFNGRSNNATAIDATSGQVVGTVDLGGKPEEPALDGKGNMFVNLEDKSAIMEFDTKTLAVKGNWPLAPCEGPSALAVDVAHRRLFAACDKVMAVINADTGKVVASPPIGGDPDGDGFDPATGLIFASCREGLMSDHSRGFARQVQRGRQRHHAVRRAHDGAGPEDAPRVYGDGGFQGGRAGNCGQSTAAASTAPEFVCDFGASSAVTSQASIYPGVSCAPTLGCCTLHLCAKSPVNAK